MRFRLLSILFLVLSLAACNLGASDDNDQDEPIDFPTNTPAGKPEVVITSPQSGDEFVVQEPLFVEATVTDSVGVTQVQLLANNQPVRTVLVDQSNNRSSQPVLDYQPRTAGDVTLTVIAYRGNVASDPASVTVTVRQTQAQVTATSAPGNNQPVIDPNDPNCRVLINVNLNLRTGPSTDFAVIRTLAAGSVLPVTGRISDNTWLQITSGSTVGWVSASNNYVSLYDGTLNLCRNVPVVQAPPTPTPRVTNTPVITNTPIPTQTPLPTQTTVPSTNTPVPKPDLTITNVTGNQSVTIPGGESEVTETYSINISNLGGAANQQFSVSARVLNGDTYDVGSVGNLGSGQIISLTVDITFVSAGDNTVIFTVDSDDDVDESNEENNERFLIVTVSN